MWFSIVVSTNWLFYLDFQCQSIILYVHSVRHLGLFRSEVETKIHTLHCELNMCDYKRNCMTTMTQSFETLDIEINIKQQQHDNALYSHVIGR